MGAARTNTFGRAKWRPPFREDVPVECSVVKPVLGEKAAAQAAARSAEFKAEPGPAENRRLVYVPFWSAVFRCEIRRAFLGTRRGTVAAGADAFSGFVSLVSGIPETTLQDIPDHSLLPLRFTRPDVESQMTKQVTDYLVRRLRRVPDVSVAEFHLLYRPAWVCLLDADGRRIVRTIDAHSGDPMYYLDKLGDEIAGFAFPPS